VRKVETRRPSFPDRPVNQLLPCPPGVRWHVVCGDTGHWRSGMYSPPESSAADLKELERHDCPELFLLLSGRLTLVVADGPNVRELELKAGEPVLITAPHSGYCPDGPGTGVAFVVERDSFDTEYRTPDEWTSQAARDEQGG
jgi:hypothetical protein